MKEFFLVSAQAGVLLSAGGYFLGAALKRKFRSGLCNPLLIAVIFVIFWLVFFKVDYEAYYGSAKNLSLFLTPATVALAVPLYEKIKLLKENAAAVGAGILSGVFTSLLSVFATGILFSLSHEEYVTLLPKSVTTAIGMGLSAEHGGYSQISAAVIILTGIFGNIAAQPLCALFKIRHPISQGIAIGTASHAIGTSKAMEMGDIQGAMSSLAIVVSGLCTVILMGVFAGLI